VIARGYEGYVAKDEASVYERGDEALVEGRAEGLDGEEDGGGLSSCRRLPEVRRAPAGTGPPRARRRRAVWSRW
jgi:hypothetical protein